MVYAITGSEVLSSVQEDFDRLEQWKLGKETITQTAVEHEGVIVRDNSQLKVVNGVVEYDAEAVAEQAEAQKQNSIKQLESLAFTQQNKIIDQNMSQFLWDMFKSFDLSVCPIAKNYKDFLDALWLQYHTDKASLNFDVDYSTIVPANEYSYQEIEAEYIANK